ncbi:MAG TPA: LamG-like jellyroll fold domain-containing protein, partial [Verrucomicrobiae bacterium]|nr:LamG-like jellyroll fold domain-containing protein [Verrucomicrobiae bacterium]
AVVGGVTVTSPTITVQTTVPTITQQPSPVTAVVGETATFTVQALGGSLNYQWNKGNTPISGATNNTLVLSNLTLSQSGSYSVTVSNSLGSTNSISVALNVQTAILQHRYSFVSDASDSVGGANGTLIAGNNPATIANGLFLPGSGTSGNPSGYVSLPNGVLQGDTSVSIECWATQNQPNTWAEIWSFGVNGGSQNFGLIPSSPQPNMRVAFTPPGNGEVDIMANAPMPSGVEEYLAVTYDNSDLTGSLYTNGVLYANVVLPNSNYSPGNYGNSTDDTIGSDPYGGDAQFNGTVYELRIWNGALSPLQLAVDAAAGPGTVVTNLTPQSVTVSVTNSSLVGGQTEQADVTATFQGVTGSVEVTGAATNWTSADTNILVVNNTGLITAISAGSTTVSATVGGTTGTSSSITVTPTAPIITQEPEGSAVLITGGTLHASVSNIGTAPFTYRWYFNSSPNPIPGANSSTLVLANVQAANSGNYVCVVSNSVGTTNSTPLALTVITPSSYQSDVLALGPVALWPLNEPSGAPIAYDIVGGYNGTYNGSLTAGYPGPTNSEFSSTPTNDSVFFFGGYVDIPGGPFNITGAITVSAWVQMSGTSGFEDVVGHGDQSWRLTVNPSGQPGANDGSTPNDATSLSAIADGNWHNIIYTYDGSLSGANGLLYVDGALKANNEIAAVPAGDNLDVWIGGAPDYPGARMFSGFIANVAVFNKALSASQIAGLYNGTVTVTIQRSGGNVIVSWPSGKLLQAPTVNGPWTTNNAATSPYTVPASGASQFFKVQVSP